MTVTPGFCGLRSAAALPYAFAGTSPECLSEVREVEL
jgi:hypothetical protein